MMQWSARSAAGRRRFLAQGAAAVSAGFLPEVLAARSQAAAHDPPFPAKQVIVIFLQGGLAHQDSFDLKPAAPAEYRGEFRPIATAVPGLDICEHLPMLARRADSFSVLRSVHHGTPSHEAAIHWTLTGYDYPGANTSDRNRNIRPAIGSIVARLRGPNNPGLPAYVCVPDRGQLGNRVRFASATYLGAACDPIETGPAPRDARTPFPPPQNLLLNEAVSRPRLDARVDLLHRLDELPRVLDASGSMTGIDDFNRMALELLSHDRTRRAFDASEETVETRLRYGNSEFAQRLLLARRLAEAGVTFTLVNFSNNQDWDTHSDNFRQLKSRRLPELDQAVSALLDDLRDRSLLDSTLVALYGEFGRTPLINPTAGRDHWSNVFSVVLAGGGLRGGMVIGSSSANAEEPRDRPIHFNEVTRTIYRQLGVPTDHSFTDYQGRPVPVLDYGSPIRELI